MTGGEPAKREQVMAKANPFEFIQQVRAETRKVTWPSRREVIITTIMVFIMVTLASLFFLAADQILSFGVGFLLGTR
jgi:preprotein translocase subunit SecE